MPVAGEAFLGLCPLLLPVSMFYVSVFAWKSLSGYCSPSSLPPWCQSPELCWCSCCIFLTQRALLSVHSCVLLLYWPFPGLSFPKQELVFGTLDTVPFVQERLHKQTIKYLNWFLCRQCSLVFRIAIFQIYAFQLFIVILGSTFCIERVHACSCLAC